MTSKKGLENINVKIFTRNNAALYNALVVLDMHIDIDIALYMLKGLQVDGAFLL